jgi:hypothetical protein
MYKLATQDDRLPSKRDRSPTNQQAPSLGGDKGYHSKVFMNFLRRKGLRPHIARCGALTAVVRARAPVLVGSRAWPGFIGPPSFIERHARYSKACNTRRFAYRETTNAALGCDQ